MATLKVTRFIQKILHLLFKFKISSFVGVSEGVFAYNLSLLLNLATMGNIYNSIRLDIVLCSSQVVSIILFDLVVLGCRMIEIGSRGISLKRRNSYKEKTLSLRRGDM